MPLDMTVEEPDSRVVGLKPQDDESVGVNDYGVAAHRDGREGVICDARVLECARLVVGAEDGLEIVPVQMKGMFSRIDVVDDDLDDLILLEDEWVGVRAIDGRVSSELAGGKDSVQRRDLGGGVGYIVEEGTVRVSRSTKKL
jgi:hypothetical protein